MPKLSIPRCSGRVWAAVFLALFVWAFGAAVVVGEYRAYNDLVSHVGVWQVGVASITSTNCRNHGRVSFVYEVDGHTYRRTSNAGAGFPECDQLHPGDQIPIAYDPASPGSAISGTLEVRIRNRAANINFLPWPLFGIGLLVLIFGVAGARRPFVDRQGWYLRQYPTASPRVESPVLKLPYREGHSPGSKPPGQ